jgi:hypothetical protein
MRSATPHLRKLGSRIFFLQYTGLFSVIVNEGKAMTSFEMVTVERPFRRNPGGLSIL